MGYLSSIDCIEHFCTHTTSASTFLQYPPVALVQKGQLLIYSTTINLKHFLIT
uniref:Uncharacterized protein n=1 Tax=Solanum lycopersicum TaxID=4081 RepID=A0A3Q7GQG2_SOLLC